MSESGNQRHRSPPPSGPASAPPADSPPVSATLAALVRELAPGISWAEARALCRAGRVWVDEQPAADPAWRPGAGRRIELLSAAAARSREEGEREGGRDGEGRRAPSLVVYADADLVVVRKPPGLLSVPFERGDRDTLLALTRVALRRLEAGRAGRRRGPGAAAPAGNPTLRAVQRLDKETSGLVVFARHVAAQRRLQQQWAGRQVSRRYLALAHGEARDATYDTWLVADRGDGLRGSWGVWRQEAGGAGDTAVGGRIGAGRSASPHSPQGRLAPRLPLPPADARRAVTRVRVLERLRGAALLACELETGRQHQIRIHLAEAGHPLLGETVYIRDYRGPRIAAPRPMLHAAALGFLHPRDGRPLTFEEPPPADFAALLHRLRRPGAGSRAPTPRSSA